MTAVLITEEGIKYNVISRNKDNSLFITGNYINITYVNKYEKIEIIYRKDDGIVVYVINVDQEHKYELTDKVLIDFIYQLVDHPIDADFLKNQFELSMKLAKSLLNTILDVTY